MNLSDAHVRIAEPVEVPALVSLINAAYVVESFFKQGGRTTDSEVRDLMKKGRFLVLDDDERLAGCVYVEVNGRRGYFGMLSIHPEKQRRGLGTVLIRAAENVCRGDGCTEMELQVVSLRTELPPYYRKFGYEQVGTREFPREEATIQPCYFIVMRKPL